MAKEKDPFDDMVEQLTGLFDMVKDKKLGSEKGKLPKGIDQMLDDLENQVMMFKEVTEGTMEDMGVNKQETRRNVKHPPKSMKSGDKRLLGKLTHLRDEGRDIQFELKMMEQKSKGEKKKKGKGEAKKGAVRKRRSRFRKAGGSDKWKPI